MQKPMKKQSLWSKFRNMDSLVRLLIGMYLLIAVIMIVETVAARNTAIYIENHSPYVVTIDFESPHLGETRRHQLTIEPGEERRTGTRTRIGAEVTMTVTYQNYEGHGLVYFDRNRHDVSLLMFPVWGSAPSQYRPRIHIVDENTVSIIISQ
ncbi:MAG: hypothetical protein FWC79_07250 [Oscillospiraceae bacterium]|nr:hypothetical protein [Oscillospiraceae bacterium]